MHLNEIRVSVGLPVYNGEHGIHKAIRSLLCQSHKNLEIVISDNASTDGTKEICSDYCGKDARLRYIRQSSNRGPVANFKTVLELANGEYFMWLGHDDELSPTYIEECLQYFLTTQGAALVAGQAIYERDGTEVYRGKEINICDASGAERLISYYRSVSDNGTFYGLMRRENLLQCQFRAVMGSDWLNIAAIAFTGNVATLSTVFVRRALGGSSASYEKICAALGLPRIQAHFPHVTIAICAATDIVWRARHFRSIGMGDRVKLAWRAQRIIRLRHGSSLLGILRKVGILMSKSLHGRARQLKAAIFG